MHDIGAASNIHYTFTGALQGLSISSVLVTLYTDDCHASHMLVNIITKYNIDEATVGLFCSVLFYSDQVFDTIVDNLRSSTPLIFLT